MSQTKIILNCIIKNESHVLPRMLKSVLPIVDEYQIIDTGSTDNSIQIIEDFFKEKGISGNVVVNTECIELIDGKETFLYDKARNKALELLKDKEGFGLWIDADDELVLPNGFRTSEFKKGLSEIDKLNVTIVDKSLLYSKALLFRISKPFVWKGKIHEALTCSEPIKQITIPEIQIIVNRSGNSWKEENITEKYLSHVRLLQKEVDEKSLPRDIFYLAKSYQSAGQMEKAVEYFKKRADVLSDVNEESYYSQFMMSIIKSKLGVDFKEVFFDLLMCGEMDEKKAEHLLYVIILLREVKLWHSAYIFSKFAVEYYHKKNPFPSRVMIIDADVYEHRLLDLHKEICKKIGKTMELSPYMTAEDIFNEISTTADGSEQYLVPLRGYATGCKTITDLSLVESHFIYSFIVAKPKTIIRYGVSHTSGIKQIKSLTEKEKIGFEFISRDVNRLQIKETDLLLIDTIKDSSLSNKLKMHSKNVNKYIIIYGIADSIKIVIEEFLEKNADWNISDVYTRDSGLCVLARGKWEGDRVTKFSNF